MEVYVQLKTDPKWATVTREKRLSTAESDLEIVQSRIDEFMGEFCKKFNAPWEKDSVKQRLVLEEGVRSW